MIDDQEVLQKLPADESVDKGIESIEVFVEEDNPEISLDGEIFVDGYEPEIAVCYFYGVDEEGNLIETPIEGGKDPQEEIFVRGEGEIQPYWRTLTGGEENADVVEFDADGNPISHHVEFEVRILDHVEFEVHDNPILYPIDPIIDENGWPIWWCVLPEILVDENGKPIDPFILYKGEMMEAGSIDDTLLPIEGEGKGDNPYVDENGNPIQTLGGGDPVVDPIVIECEKPQSYFDDEGNPIYTLGGMEIDPVLRNLQLWLADDSTEEKAEVKITRQKDISFSMKSSGDEVQELSWDDLINQRVAFHSESAKSSFTMESGDHRYVHGKTGSDKINGGKGDDWLDGNGGKDSFKAGKGDDHILVDDGKVRSIDGGQGDDTLVLRSDLGAMDLSKVKTLKGIETIDLLSGSGNGLTLTLTAKQIFKNHVDTVKILGDSFDSLVIQGEKVQLQTLVADPEGFASWQVSWHGHQTTLLVDAGINVV